MRAVRRRSVSPNVASSSARKAGTLSKSGDDVSINGAKPRLCRPREKGANQADPREITSITLGLSVDDKPNLIDEATKMRPQAVEFVR